jgi:hypothetical protein
MIAPIFGPEGELAYFMGSQMEVGSGAPYAAQQDARAGRLALAAPARDSGAMAAAGSTSRSPMRWACRSAR